MPYASKLGEDIFITIPMKLQVVVAKLIYEDIASTLQQRRG